MSGDNYARLPPQAQEAISRQVKSAFLIWILIVCSVTDSLLRAREASCACVCLKFMEAEKDNFRPQHNNLCGAWCGGLRRFADNCGAQNSYAEIRIWLAMWVSLLTLSAHAREGYSRFACVCVTVCVTLWL